MRHAERDQIVEWVDREGTSRHRWADAYPPSAAAVEAVAGRAGVDATALAPLYDAIDPDALDDLFRSRGGRTRRSSARVTFFYAGYEVTVEHDGWLAVTGEDEG